MRRRRHWTGIAGKAQLQTRYHFIWNDILGGVAGMIMERGFLEIYYLMILTL